MARSPRPKTCHFTSDDLMAEWMPLLKLREPGFSWDGSCYGKPSRAQSADKDGLAAYRLPLLGLLRLAPSGSPAYAALRNTLVEAHKKWGVLKCDDQFLFKTATAAADIWRIMCRDVYLLSKAKASSIPDTLKSLVSIIQAPYKEAQDTGGLASTDFGVSHVNELFAEFDELDKECGAWPSEIAGVDGDSASSWVDGDDAIAISQETADDDHVFITGEICRCPKCAPVDVPIPDPRRRRKKPAASAAPPKRRRLIGKQTVCTTNVVDGVPMADRPLVLPCKVSFRNKSTGKNRKPLEAKILEATKGRNYVIAQSQKQSPSYKANITELCARINAGGVRTRAQAREWLASVR